MELLQDGVIALLAAIGLASLFWGVASAIFPLERCTNPEILLVLPVHGEASAMGSDLRELLRVRRTLPNATIVLADRGLSPAARELAEYWCARECGVTLQKTPIDV